jgi:NitT/TauT family transport system ATP-binding protein
MTRALTIREVGRRFGDVVAIDTIDLDVDAGELVTVLGPSGSGKTTLLRIVAGLDRPTTGTVSVGGVEPLEARRHKRIGWVPQSPALLPWRTARDNVRLVTQVNRRANRPNVPDADELLAQVGLSGFERAYPHQLSGGMQQRVALVRAFALGAEVLLMDEPFAALDEITRADMRHLLLSLWERSGATVLFVTHSVEEAAYLSDRVVVLSARPGRITRTVPIPLRRPRTPEIEDEPEFFEITRALRHALHDGMGR